MNSRIQPPRRGRLVLSVGETAELLEVSSDTIYAQIRAGKIQPVPGLRPYRIRVRDIEEMVGRPIGFDLPLATHASTEVLA